MTAVENRTAYIPPLRVLYIPHSLDVVKDDLRLASNVEYLKSHYTKEDILHLYIENERFLRGDVDRVFKDFTPFFQDDEWTSDHNKDIEKELDILNLKRKNKVILRESWKNLDVRFNGRILYLIECESCQHDSFHSFYDKVLTTCADAFQINTLQQLEVYKHFCLQHEPDTALDSKEINF